MVRAFVVYEGEVDEGRFARHAELCRKVEGAAAFRSGKVFGSPMGEPRFKYNAEWEFPDRDAFNTAARTPEFMETGRDAVEMGVPFTVSFAELSE